MGNTHHLVPGMRSFKCHFASVFTLSIHQRLCTFLFFFPPTLPPWMILCDVMHGVILRGVTKLTYPGLCEDSLSCVEHCLKDQANHSFLISFNLCDTCSTMSAMSAMLIIKFFLSTLPSFFLKGLIFYCHYYHWFC